MRPLSVRALARPHEGIVIDDLVLLPQPLQISEYVSAWQQVLKQCPVLDSLGLTFNQQPSESERTIVYRMLYGAFQSCCLGRHLQKAEWWPNLPASVRSDIAFYRWLQEATLNVINFPNTGIRYSILENGMTDQVIAKLGLFRLSGVKQLGYLTDPIVHYIGGGVARGETLEHSRYQHSLDVMAIATCIGRNCKVTGPELKSLQFAALTHDILTPAGGDATKRVSPIELDEDTNFRKVFAKKEFPRLRDRFQLDPELIFSTIQNEGLLGQILDIADKLAYVARDLPSYLINVEPSETERQLLPNEYEQLSAYARNAPDICGVWETFRRHGDLLVCHDPERLADFLYVRLLLFRQFYANPATRFHEATTVRIVLEHLFETGAITVNRVLIMRDLQLEDLMSKVLGLQAYELCTAAAVGMPGYCTVHTEAEALAYCHKLVRQGAFPTLYEYLQPLLKRSSNKFNVIAPDGSIELLSSAYPELEERLLDAEHLDEPWAVYWLTDFNSRTSDLFRTLVHNNIKRRFLLPQ
jgi:hypothetical protein